MIKHIRLRSSPHGVLTYRPGVGITVETHTLDGVIPGVLVTGPGPARKFFPATNILEMELEELVAEKPELPSAEDLGNDDSAPAAEPGAPKAEDAFPVVVDASSLASQRPASPSGRKGK